MSLSRGSSNPLKSLFRHFSAAAVALPVARPAPSAPKALSTF